VCQCGVRSVTTCIINMDTYYLRGPKSPDRTIPVIDDDDDDDDNDSITIRTICMSIIMLPIDILYGKCECVYQCLL